jgi:glutaminyl-tRNA synthetase
LILHHSNKVKVKDIEEEALTKLYTMSKVKWQRLNLAIENLQNDLNNFSLFETQLSELKSIEKTKSVTIINLNFKIFILNRFYQSKALFLEAFVIIVSYKKYCF